MAKREHTEEQIFAGTARGRERHQGRRDLPRGTGSETFYIGKKDYSGLGLGELREIRHLCEDNLKLMRLVVGLSLDRHMLQEIVRKKL